MNFPKACLAITFCLSFFVSGLLVFQKIKNRQEFWHSSFNGLTGQLVGISPTKQSYKKLILYRKSEARSTDFYLKLSLGEGI